MVTFLAKGLRPIEPLRSRVFAGFRCCSFRDHRCAKILPACRCSVNVPSDPLPLLGDAHSVRFGARLAPDGIVECLDRFLQTAGLSGQFATRIRPFGGA